VDQDQYEMKPNFSGSLLCRSPVTQVVEFYWNKWPNWTSNGKPCWLADERYIPIICSWQIFCLNKYHNAIHCNFGIFCAEAKLISAILCMSFMSFWLRHCATSRKVAGSISQWCHWNFRGHKPSGRTLTL
jgi:hypothetical protein